MPIRVACPSCGKSLQAPDSAAGKRAKCPECGKVLVIPEPIQEAEEVPDEYGLQGDLGDSYGVQDLLDEADRLPPPTAGPLPTMSAPQPAPRAPVPGAGPMIGRRPCPACGEMIMSTAAVCRYCGEVFDTTLKRKRRRRGGGDDEEDLTTGDWLVAVLCSGIGCIVGIIWLIQGKPKGGKMLGVSLLFVFIWNVIRFAMMGVQGGP